MSTTTDPAGGDTTGVDHHVVIVGAGQAGGDLAAHLREKGFRGRVTMLGSEKSHPYHRPPLSKAFLLGEKSEDDLLIRSEETYERFDIGVRTGVTVSSIERESKRVVLNDGEFVQYDSLVLATGGSARRFPVDGLARVSNIHYLRDMSDSTTLRGHLSSSGRMVIIGGGYVGLEVAAVARTLGLSVTVVEREDRLLARVTSEVTSSYFARVHQEEGVRVLTGRTVADFDINDSDELVGVVLDDGTRIDTDVCLIGIGLAPNTALADGAGLCVQDGIKVDAHFRTEDPAIYAIGDVARFPYLDFGTLRLESIPNSSDHARALADTLTGNPTPYDAVPWFWSDQYELKLQAAGMAAAGDTIVVRGDLDTDRSISVFYLRDGVVRAAEIVSKPRDFAVAKRMVARQSSVDATLLADITVPLKDLLPTVGAHRS